MALRATRRTRTKRNSKPFRWPGMKSGRRNTASPAGRFRVPSSTFRVKPATTNPEPGTTNPEPMKVYLDNSATTATAPEVIEAMLHYFSDEMGNAQSVHSFGQRAKAAVEKARR